MWQAIREGFAAALELAGHAFALVHEQHHDVDHRLPEETRERPGGSRLGVEVGGHVAGDGLAGAGPVFVEQASLAQVSVAHFELRVDPHQGFGGPQVAVVVLGVRLGERPHGGRHNMPSGHASLASSAVYFVGRRYGWWHLLYLVPVLLLTMFARVELDAHTGSAVIAGALIGIFSAALFTGKYRS